MIKLDSHRTLTVALSVFASGLLAIALGCGAQGIPPGAYVGRPQTYDYSPSVIQSGDIQQFWWCGKGTNPTDSSQDTDAILYASIDTSTHIITGPFVVMGESSGAWDSAYVCNPKVVRGTFKGPLTDGQTYTYAMYYVGTALTSGTAASIGVAFSNDGIQWNKYPEPVIQAPYQGGYGIGQPAVYNSDQQAGIWVFYEQDIPTLQHLEATSTDGLHFTTQGVISTNGIDPLNVQSRWGDMAHDSATNSWYAVFNLPLRDPSTTGDVVERGQYGVTLYRIPEAALLNGTTSWQQLMTIDTNSTGFECNFIAGLERDQYGNVNVGSYPAIQVYPSISNPAPQWDAPPKDAGLSCKIATWDIGQVTWMPGSSTLALTPYFNNKVHEVTTGWVDPNGGFQPGPTLGHLYANPQQGAMTQFYGCKNGSMDYFISRDPACEGSRILGLDGYGYAQPVSGLNLVPLYRCYSGHDHFASQDPKCEGQQTDQLLGYILP